MNRFEHNNQLNASLPSQAEAPYIESSFWICVKCAIIAALLCGVSGSIAGILAQKGYLATSSLIFFSEEDFWHALSYFSLFCGFIGGALGATAGYISYSFNKSFWETERY